MVDLTTEQFEAAQARGEARMRGPRAERAHYDAGRNRDVCTDRFVGYRCAARRRRSVAGKVLPGTIRTSSMPSAPTRRVCKYWPFSGWR